MRRISGFASAIVLGLFLLGSAANAQFGTAFMYQGSLESGGSPASGNFDMKFSLWDGDTGGAQQGASIEYDVSGAGTIEVTDGLFNVSLNFGGGIFDGDPRWLEVSVRNEDPSDTAPYTTLSPRVELLPVPYALHAATASTALMVSAGAIASQSLATDAVTTEKILNGTIAKEDFAAGLRNTLDAADGDPTNAVYVDAEGLVGVNSMTPAAWLHVVGPSDSELAIIPRDTDGTGLNNPASVAVSGDLAYVIDSNTAILTIFDISDPDNIIARDTASTGLFNPKSVAASGIFAYVGGAFPGSLAIFDVSDPDNIVARDTDGTGIFNPGTVVVSGNFAYIVDQTAAALAIFDVSDPNNIVARDTETFGLSDPTSLAVSGNFAYVVDSGTNVLAIFDVSDPDNIVARDIDGTGLLAPLSVAVSGDFAYVLNAGTGTLAIFDVSDPDNIVARDAEATGGGLSQLRYSVGQFGLRGGFVAGRSCDL